MASSNSTPLDRWPLAWPARLVLVFVAYYSSARLGLLIPFVGSHITLVWLPSGIAVAAYLRWGWSMAVPVALAAWLVNLTAGSGTSLAVGGGIALGNAAGPALTA